MNNFANFIEEDIDAKKTLFSTMPTKTKTDIKNFNEKIDSVSKKYDEYKANVRQYLDVKSKSFNVKEKDNKSDALRDKVVNLEHIKFILNPSNSFFEKMGFDNLLYKISNYSEFNFNSLNEIIDEFLDKFDLAAIKLDGSDFDYTCYVNEYMISFLEIRSKEDKNYDDISEIFEKIYWANPEIVGHIELNFRKLIRKHTKGFINYVENLKKEIMLANEINNYDDCLSKLKSAYVELKEVDKENISDIIELSKSGKIDINNYFEESKVRISTYNNLMIDTTYQNDKLEMEKFYDNLAKLKTNIEEYNNYIKFLPLINDFKNEYKKQIPTGESTKSGGKTKLKSIETQIISIESKLDKINHKIFNGKIAILMPKNANVIRQLKLNSIKQAQDLYGLYKEYDKEYFNEKVLSILNSSLTISELLHLYYSFDYFKKNAIKRVFDITTYNDVIKYSDEFDLFALNPTNIIINGVTLFEEDNISKVIMNKYRLDNVNLTDENLNPDDLGSLIDKIQLLLRIDEIEKSTTTVEKIWFMSQVEKIINIKNAEK